MADEQKQSWWKSLPGILAAATGFVAALSGLVAGLNQLGVFRREQPVAPVAAPVAMPRESSAPPPAVGESTSSSVTAAAREQKRPSATTSPGTGAPSAAVPPQAPPAAPASSATAADTARAEARLAKGTTLELTVPVRTCAPANGQRRFTARLAAPVRVGGATVLPAGTAAILHVRRVESSTAPAVRLDSLVRQDLSTSVPAATVRIRRGAASGACLQADARMTATLGAAVTLRRR
jgi:hypothetical protein